MASQYPCLADITCLGLAQLHQALLLVALPPRAPPLQAALLPQLPPLLLLLQRPPRGVRAEPQARPHVLALNNVR
jgi:hypothetical protein